MRTFSWGTNYLMAWDLKTSASEDLPHSELVNFLYARCWIDKLLVLFFLSRPLFALFITTSSLFYMAAISAVSALWRNYFKNSSCIKYVFCFFNEWHHVSLLMRSVSESADDTVSAGICFLSTRDRNVCLSIGERTTEQICASGWLVICSLKDVSPNFKSLLN